MGKIDGLQVYNGQYTGPQRDAFFDMLAAKPSPYGFTPVIGKGKQLLDNGYFIGGGSQQGGGQFPINQRAGTIEVDGQTVPGYAGTKYSFDRWVLASNSTFPNPTVTLSEDGVALRGALNQWLEPEFIKWAGKTLTLSVKFKGNNGRVHLFVRRDVYEGYGEVTSTDANGVLYTTVTIPADYPGRFGVIVETKNGSAIIEAVKLELGTEQTLARNIGTDANPNWVLNDPPPNYQQELAKCQRYQFVTSLNADYGMGSLGQMHNIGSNPNAFYFDYYLPTTLRIRPYGAVTFLKGSISDIEARSFKDNSVVPINSIAFSNLQSKNVINFYVTTSGVTEQLSARISLTNGASILFDANL